MFIQRDIQGKIIGLFLKKQPQDAGVDQESFEQEELPDDDGAIVEFLAAQAFNEKVPSFSSVVKALKTKGVITDSDINDEALSVDI